MGKEVGEEEGKETAQADPSRESSACWVFCLEFLSLSCRQEPQGRSWGRVSADYSSVFEVRPFRVMVSMTGQWQGRKCLVIAVGPGITHLVLLLFWA